MVRDLLIVIISAITGSALIVCLFYIFVSLVESRRSRKESIPFDETKIRPSLVSLPGWRIAEKEAIPFGDTQIYIMDLACRESLTIRDFLGQFDAEAKLFFVEISAPEPSNPIFSIPIPRIGTYATETGTRINL